MYSINDVMRQKIFDNSPLEFFLFFDTLLEKEQEFVFRIMLSDYYKIVYNYNKEGLKLFNYDVEFLLDFCNENPDIFYGILNVSKSFYDLDKFSKCILLETMEELNQDRKLLSISKTHILDKTVYSLTDDLENYKEYYKDFIDKNKNDSKAKNKIIDYFVFKTIELRYDNEFQYKKNVLEFIKVYYKWKKFIKEHEGEYLLSDLDFNYIEKIENRSIDQIFDYLENDLDFLVCMLEEYMHYSTQKMEIPENIINNYYEDNCDKVKKKLNL